MNQYLSPHETAALVALIAEVEPKVMIEIGVNIGETAKTILDAVPSLERYIGIDVPFDHVPTLACQQREVPSDPGHLAADDPRFFLLLREGGSQALAPGDLEPCDAVFIDGDHSEQAVAHDAMLARASVRPGGIIVFHDYNNPTVEVTQALNRFKEQGWAIEHVKPMNSWLAFLRT